MQSVSSESCFQLLQILRCSLARLCDPRENSSVVALCFIWQVKGRTLKKKNSNYKKHPASSFFHGTNAGVARSELLWMRVVPGAPRDAASHPSSGSRREIQKMLRIYSGGKSCGGAPSLGAGLACSHHALPASPAALFSIHSIHRLIRYYKLQPLLRCWHVPVFQHSPHVLQERGWQLPSFGCSGCCS